MAQTTELTCFIGRKVNDGNYGSIDFVSGEKIVLDDGDDADAEYDAMRARVYKRVMRELAERGIEP